MVPHSAADILDPSIGMTLCGCEWVRVCEYVCVCVCVCVNVLNRMCSRIG